MIYSLWDLEYFWVLITWGPPKCPKARVVGVPHCFSPIHFCCNPNSTFKHNHTHRCFMHFCIISYNSHDNLGHIFTPSTRFSSQKEKNFEEEKKRGKILPVEEITRPCLILQIMSSRKNVSTQHFAFPFWPPSLPKCSRKPLKYFPSVPKNHLNTSQVFLKITFVFTISQSTCCRCGTGRGWPTP